MARKSRFRSKKGYADGLQKRTEAAVGSRGGKWKPIFRTDVKFERWSCKEGDHVIDIIPYLDENDVFQYKHEVLVHQRIGPDEGNYVCPKTYDSQADCPLCTARAKAQAIDDEDTAKLLRPRDRVVYNIVCYDNDKEENKGVQVWEASSFLSEENFQAAAKKRKKGGDNKKIAFADPDVGRTISFERTGTGMTTKYVGFAMDERDEPISDDILDEAYILEDLLDVPSVETLQEQADIVMGGAGAGEDEESPDTSGHTHRRGKGRKKEEDKGTGDDVPDWKDDEGTDGAEASGGEEKEEKPATGRRRPAARRRTARRE